jgi:hypothetical protein
MTLTAVARTAPKGGLFTEVGEKGLPAAVPASGVSVDRRKLRSGIAAKAMGTPPLRAEPYANSLD